MSNNTINKNISIDDFTYNLPDESIAKYPLEKRDESKLLIYNKGEYSHTHFKSLPEYLDKDVTLVYNNTKVIQARLNFTKSTGAAIEVFCLEPYDPSDYQIAFQQKERCQWKCLVGNLKKWKDHELTMEIIVEDDIFILHAAKKKKVGTAVIIEFSWECENITFSQILESIGSTPIPPYLNRESEEKDQSTYQTVYSKHKGSVAAPTAGLHFTDDVLLEIMEKEINIQELTLHIGAGTFQPVLSEVFEHSMHVEHFSVTKSTIHYLLYKAKKIYAVGTTSVRTLESIYWLGVNILDYKMGNKNAVSQWGYAAHKQDISSKDALKALLDYMEINKLSVLNASTQIMIVPGYKFRMIDGLITNFHQPRSTLLLLISAFIGDDWKKVYDYAKSNKFRFLSYGDSSLLIPKNE